MGRADTGGSNVFENFHFFFRWWAILRLIGNFAYPMSKRVKFAITQLNMHVRPKHTFKSCVWSVFWVVTSRVMTQYSIKWFSDRIYDFKLQWYNLTKWILMTYLSRRCKPSSPSLLVGEQSNTWRISWYKSAFFIVIDQNTVFKGKGCQNTLLEVAMLDFTISNEKYKS